MYLQSHERIIMKWTKATIDTTVEAIDFICIMLDEKGVEGIEIEDNVGLTPKEIATMYKEPSVSTYA